MTARRARDRLRRRRARARRCASTCSRRARTSTATISRRAPAADPATRTVHFEIDLPDPDARDPRRHDRRARASTSASPCRRRRSRSPPRRCAATRRPSSSSRATSRTRARSRVKGEVGGSLFVDADARAGRARRHRGARAARRRRPRRAPRRRRPSLPRRRPRRRRPPGDDAVTGLSLRNPIAVLMLCIGARRLRGRRHAAHERRHLPRADAAGARHRHARARASGRRTSRRRITWRLEKYVSATPGRRSRRERLAQQPVSIIYVWLKWGTDLNAAQTLVQQQAAFAMAAVPKSLGVLPPFVLQYDPSNAPVVQVVVYRRRAHRAAALRLRVQQHRAAARGHPRRRQRRAQRRAAAADQRRRRSGARRRRAASPSSDVAAAVAQVERAPAVGRVHLAAASTPTSTPTRSRSASTTIGDAPVKVDDGKAGPHPRRRARRGRRHAARRSPSRSTAQDAVYLNVLRIPGGNTIEIVDAVKKRRRATCKDLPPGLRGQGVLRSVDLRAHDLPRPARRRSSRRSS